MKKILGTIAKFTAPIEERVKNLLFAAIPMMYIWYTYGISYHGHHPIAASIGLSVTFLLFVFVHIKYIKRSYIADKLRVQVILANLALEVAMFNIALDSAGSQSRFGSIGLTIAIICGIALGLFFTLLQVRDHDDSVKKAFSGDALYQSLIAITMAGFTVFFIYQVYVFWATLYIFVPVVTSSLMLATIYKNGILHENSQSPLNLFATIPFMLLIGIVSVVFQFPNVLILGFKVWKIFATILSIIAIMAIMNWVDTGTMKSWKFIDGGEDEV